MRFTINDRTINQDHTILGYQGDSNVEIIEFVLPRTYGNVDLYTGFPFLLFSQKGQEPGYILLDNSTEMTVDGENLILTWKVGSQVTSQRGTLETQIRISGLDSELWHSEITYFTVGRSIQVESPQPMMYRSMRTVSPEAEPPIVIAERKIIIPSELQNIAVQNDENSETVTIRMMRYFDGHDLSLYHIYLKTVSEEGGRDDILFATPTVSGNEISMRWTLKPPQTSFNGKLQIQLYVQGENFKWETADTFVNIMRSLDAEPVIPTTPSVMGDFLRELERIAEAAKSSENKAKISENNAAESAKEAADYVESIYFNLKAPPVSIINEAVILDCGTPAIIKGMG